MKTKGRHRRLSPADELRVAAIEAAATRHGHVLAPRGTCPPCDAGRGIMWTDEERRGVPSCAVCVAMRENHRELERLVCGWGAKQREVAARGGWTTEELTAHSRALDGKDET